MLSMLLWTLQSRSQYCWRVNLLGWGFRLTPAWAVQAVERDFLRRAFATVKDLELRRIAAIKDVIVAFAEAYRCTKGSHFTVSPAHNSFLNRTMLPQYQWSDTERGAFHIYLYNAFLRKISEAFCTTTDGVCQR